MGLFSRWTGPGGAEPAETGFAGTVRSLLNLEINTILADSMSAEPMPPLPHAVLDIADWYATYLCRLGANVDKFTCAPPGPALKAQAVTWDSPKSFSAEHLKFDTDTFDALRCAAEAALNDNPARPPALTSLDRVMLYRIVKNCDAVKALFVSIPNVDSLWFWGKFRTEISGKPIDRNSYYISPDEIVTLQRIWDLGTQTVVAQTVVFLNGNVTTRIQKGMDGVRDQTLFDVHRQSVDVSIGCWRYLLQAIREVVGTAVGVLLKPK